MSVRLLSEARDATGALTHKMCCFCFRMVTVAQLWRDELGQPWDSCGRDQNACPPATQPRTPAGSTEETP